MSDVIFGGSKGRKPLGLAEVSLCFVGAEGIEQAEQGKVVVTRRLFRTGESEYRLNGQRTRLKDVQDLLRQSRVGARTYATIEQGKIDQVLNAKPRDRRALIEDAAGISGYKHKRRLAEFKLEATQANLLRVNDIVLEVQRQINSLKRQAAKARRYRKLREELRSKELLRFARRAGEMDRELVRLRGEESAARDAEAEATAKLAKLEAGLAEQRQGLEKANNLLRESSERLHQLEIEIDREEGQIRTCRERITEATERAARQRSDAEALEARHREAAEQAAGQDQTLESCRVELQRMTAEIEAAQQEVAGLESSSGGLRREIAELRERQFATMARSTELRNRARAAAETLGRIAERRTRLEQEREEARDDLTRLATLGDELKREAAQHSEQVEARRDELRRDEASIEAARDREKADVESLSKAREREQSARGRMATLEDLETRFAGASDGAKSLLSGAASGIATHGVIADYIEASREVEGAAERYLQHVLPTVILDGDADACRAAEFLKSQGAGRTSLISKSQPAGALAVGHSPNGRGEVPVEILQDRRVLGKLRDKLTLKSAANGVVSERIGDAILVDSLESALELHRRYPGADYLTKAGEIVYASGMISAGGEVAHDQGFLAHRRRLEEVRGDVETASKETARLQSSVDALRGDLGRLQASMRERRESLEQAERRKVELDLRLQRFSDESERGGRRSEVLEDELAAMRAEVESLEQERQRFETESAEAERLQGDLDRELEAKLQQVERDDETLKQKMAGLTELRAAQAASRERLEAIDAETRRIQGAVTELQERLEAARGDADAATALAESTRELLATTEGELTTHLEQRKTLQEKRSATERDIEERRERLAADEADLHRTRASVETTRDKSREAELVRARAQADREHLDELCRQELGMVAADAQIPEGEDPGEIDLELLEEELEQIKQKIERLGPVNMTAIDEFSELEERHTFLSAQHEDLQKSMESLRETIRRINRESRQRFTEAFEQIRNSYQEVFKLLFSGGRADLRLEEGEDVLECGIDILAQPPGKRLAGVHLLSGGEKALSAIALLFAIFRYQPSPFCMLDEVDAALDDSNVGRFARMVGEYAKNTQFVIITHNKLSMEAADRLYGVSMEEPGVSKVVSLQMS
jgi:chromosome segregation protein